MEGVVHLLCFNSQKAFYKKTLPSSETNGKQKRLFFSICVIIFWYPTCVVSALTDHRYVYLSSKIFNNIKFPLISISILLGIFLFLMVSIYSRRIFCIIYTAIFCDIASGTFWGYLSIDTTIIQLMVFVCLIPILFTKEPACSKRIFCTIYTIVVGGIIYELIVNYLGKGSQVNLLHDGAFYYSFFIPINVQKLINFLSKENVGLIMAMIFYTGIGFALYFGNNMFEKYKKEMLSCQIVSVKKER
jgi:hypothetical protein